MSRSPNFGPILGIVVVALVIGAGVGWWASRTPERPKPSSHPAAETTTETTNVAVEKPAAVEPVEPLAVPEKPAEEPVNALNWEDKVDQIITEDKTDTDQKADKLADLIVKLPEDAARDTAEHLINLVSDEEFPKKTAGILLNEKTPKSVATVIFDDMMNRNDSLRLPLTLQIAKNERHPLHEEALELLQTSLTEDFGKDWEKWQSAIDENLKTQGFETDTNVIIQPNP